MTPSVKETCEKDRDACKTHIHVLERELKHHATTLFSQVEVEQFLQEIEFVRVECLQTQRKLAGTTSKQEEVDAFEAEHIKILSELNKVRRGFFNILATFPSKNKPPIGPPNNGSEVVGAEVKLPKLELPKFNGDRNSWISFRDMFLVSVAANTRLSDAQKLSYLQGSVTGDASRLISSISLSDANFVIAWDLLKNRFDNKRELVYACLRTLIGQKDCQRSASSIRSLIDITTGCIRSLASLEITTGDEIIGFVIVQKLDPDTREQWELSLSASSVPKVKDIFEFLEQRARALDASGSSKTSTSRTSSSGEDKKKPQVHHVTSTRQCKECNETHQLFKCPKFLSLSVPERFISAKQNGVCFNCLMEGHATTSCTSKFTCRKCNRKHNTFLHRENKGSASTKEEVIQPVVSLHINSNFKSQVLFATAIVSIVSASGEELKLRVALDNFSSDSLILESAVQRLGLAKRRYSASISGLGGASLGKCQGVTDLVISPWFKAGKDVTHRVKALVVPKLVSQLPQFTCDPQQWSHLDSLILADPNFYKSGNVDILLGGEVFWDLVLGEKRKGPEGSPMAVNSTFGWLVVGAVKVPSHRVTVHHIQSMDQMVQQFWELDPVPMTRALTQEEEKCEEVFKTSFTRISDGRFGVSLPFKKYPPSIGSSRQIAIKRLLSLERRLDARPEARIQYHAFLRKYLEMGHMQPTPQAQLSMNSCYIPHHFVQKDPNCVSKFRVVFDASAKTSNGLSLNESLMVGPTVQDSLISILMRFRSHPVAFTADIEKMYRQILINPQHQSYQRIVWRESQDSQPVDYDLLTVTYGTASAPYLATRVLNQLSLEEESSLPLAAAVARRDFYVDDVMSGAEDEEKGIILSQQLFELTRRGKFPLVKWASNSQSLINSIPQGMRATQAVHSINFVEAEVVSTLGLNWNTTSDTFSFRVKLPPFPECLTKRTLLSEISRIFDPLGWISPTVTSAKILFQELWKLDFGWDDVLPKVKSRKWEEIRNSLPQLERICIPRCIVPAGSIRLDLHGFCDASEKAYAAVVYLRSWNKDGGIVSHIISSRSKVAPTKTVSLPRLELCGALLLSSLIKQVKSSYCNITFEETHAWTDSTVVLAWLQYDSSKWKTFVANRVTKIQKIVSNEFWHHVPGVDNPADCASRGVSVEELINHPLWWRGPKWLMEESLPSFTSSTDSEMVEKEERKSVTTHHCQLEEDTFIIRFSSFNKLKRVMAWCYRFINNSKSADGKGKVSSTGPLTTHELDHSLKSLIRQAQREVFGKELERLRSKGSLPKKSRIISLNPFLDEIGIIRVGGRIKKASVAEDRKFPMLLPHHHRLTILIIRHFHLIHHHAGCQLLLSIINGTYWIVNARDIIRHQIRKCMVCVRQRAQSLKQFMGDLPSSRVNPSPPFNKCGVDYAGPFTLKPVYGRSNSSFKAYLCLFVCYSTRALHLEVVSSLTTDAFIAALRRFVSRRGRPSHIHSDQGTNFSGAAKELRELYSLIQDQSGHFMKVLSDEGTQWHFNPPSAPHFGGIWEAGVKSVKYHLVRVIGDQRLNFEEFTTIITQVEGALNSRPLQEISSDPNDLTCLTPSHFLIGGPITTIPDPDITELNINRLSRWQLLQQVKQHFWNRWSNEFLTRL